MPNLANHQSNEYTKLLLIGDSGSGKTGACTPLVKDFNLRFLDMDNGLETLKQFVMRDYPDRLSSIEYRTLRDARKATAAGPILKGPPKAFIEAIKMLDRWKYDDVDLGVPAEWGPDCILVVDSLTMLADAAMDWAEPLTPKGDSGKFDKRAQYGIAQDAIENMISLLTSEAFETNVIVIAHVKYIEREDKKVKGYPTAVGQALSPLLPRYFNTWAACETGAGGKRTIQTKANSILDLKNPKPFEMEPHYDLSDGMAQIFSVLRKQPEPKPNLKRVK